MKFFWTKCWITIEGDLVTRWAWCKKYGFTYEIKVWKFKFMWDKTWKGIIFNQYSNCFSIYLYKHRDYTKKYRWAFSIYTRDRRNCIMWESVKNTKKFLKLKRRGIKKI